VFLWLYVQGKPSRSLQAAWKLISEGGLAADDVVHLERGLYGWYQAELPIEGEWAIIIVFATAAAAASSFEAHMKPSDGRRENGVLRLVVMCPSRVSVQASCSGCCCIPFELVQSRTSDCGQARYALWEYRIFLVEVGG
jgi:hypothetical protein